MRNYAKTVEMAAFFKENPTDLPSSQINVVILRTIIVININV